MEAHLRHPKTQVLWIAMAVGIAAVASASVLIRMAEAPALVIAAYRVGLAALALGPLLLKRRPPSTLRISKGALQTTMISGILLAIHFACWIQSLKMTTIASSVTLVSTTPVFASLLSRLCLGEDFDRWTLAGVACSVIGGAWVAGSDFAVSGDAFWGDLLAVGGAAAAAGYLVTGRSARGCLDLTTYAFSAYGTAAAILILFSAAAGLPLLGFPTRTYLILAILALVPQLIGHTTFNWALRFLSPTVVAVVLMGEPIGASLLGYLVFGEIPSWKKAAGLTVLGMGIVLCSLSARDGTGRRRAGTREEPLAEG